MTSDSKDQKEISRGQFVIFATEEIESDSPVVQAGAKDALKKIFHIKENVISVEQFQSRLIEFLNNIQTVLSNCNVEYKGFSMDTVQVSAEISADGQIGFMGTHVGIGGKGGITFEFKRV